METKYRICSQEISRETRKTFIIFQQIGCSEHIIKPAVDLAKQQELLKSFEPMDSFLIGYIAGMEADL